MSQQQERAESGFFSVAQTNGRWHLVTPHGRPFFSIGLNHIDDSPLRSPENGGLWQEKYGGDVERWVRERVAPDLREWGFNTIGWTAEVVIKTPQMHRHSPQWSKAQYRAAEMPFCHLLPFAEVHQWEVETRHPDVLSPAFAEWCDYVARRDCADLRHEPNLIGYFYSDCPNWVHPTTSPQQKGPWFDPERLRSEAGRREFALMVETYYRVTSEAVRRHDPNHLILGDRLEARAPLPPQVLEAASRWVDVLCFQFFAPASEIVPALARWHASTGKPILLADFAVPNRESLPPAEHGARYQVMAEDLSGAPFLIGWHLCGAYLENPVRRAGLRGGREQARPTLTDAIARANRRAHSGFERLGL